MNNLNKTHLADIYELSELYGIPFEDVLLIDLNRKGVICPDIDYERIRFYFKLHNHPYFKTSRERGIKDFFLAIPTHSGISDYQLVDGVISLNGETIGMVGEIENDTCDSVYPRRNGTVFNLNAISKSACRGCKFCHTFKQDAKDISQLSIEALIQKHIETWLLKYNKPDLSHLYRLDVVTGCLGSEKELLEHLFLVRDIFARYNYHREIFYFGSEITSKKAFDQLKSIAPFGLCLSLECFDNRNYMLRPHKGMITLSRAKELLDMSNERGFGTQFSYVLGIEPLELVLEKMGEFSAHINRLPVINLFQPHTPGQRDLIVPEAKHLSYFLRTRIELEKIFGPKKFRPRTWGNYRCLWYLKFGDEFLDDARLP